MSSFPRTPPHGQHSEEKLHESLRGSSCNEAASRSDPHPPKSNRIFIGPVMPSATAQLNSEAENGPFIGPPPTVVAEANDTEQIEEVTRILSPEVTNAYDLLSVKPNVELPLLKKRFWKLSLLVHPDKCHHPQAHKAFTALNQAFQDLQDPIKSDKINRKVAEDMAREDFAADMQRKCDAAQWRRVRGMVEKGDEELLKGNSLAVARGEWMTKLPQAQSGTRSTSGWTETPAGKLAQKAKFDMECSDADDPAEEREKKRARKEARLMDSYNLHMRSQSLMEKHKVGMSAKKKSEEVKKQVSVETRGNRVKEVEGKVNLTWKPWDRERDLPMGVRPARLDLKDFKKVSSRFGEFTENKTRKFL